MSYVLSFRRKKTKEIEFVYPNYKNYDGITYRPPTEWWMKYINLDYDSSIHYLEIGVFYGVHAIQVSEKLTNPSSKVYCVDPWIDYDDYEEYKGKQSKILNTFTENISKCEHNNKFEIHRGFSDDIVPTFPDNYFDIIYVDGNHETEYVYRDGCMSFQKLKKGGYMIFDDYDWKQTKVGIDNFLEEYTGKIRVISDLHWQLTVQKL